MKHRTQLVAGINSQRKANEYMKFVPLGNDIWRYIESETDIRMVDGAQMDLIILKAWAKLASKLA